MADKEKEWFKNWFDTPYYHILYKKRDDSEAASFINSLISFLAPPKGSKILDLASGKGRHSIHLHKMGFDVTGVDLSHNSIVCANQFEARHLKFIEHDMRHPLSGYKFDYIFNLFTSVGYFDSQQEDIEVLKNVKQCLMPGGVFVLDYFNAAKPHAGFDQPFTKLIDNIQFDINKHIENGRIIKNIKVTDGGDIYNFKEKVRIYTLETFKHIIEEAGLSIIDKFGSYDLEPYQPQTSDRLILVAKNIE